MKKLSLGTLSRISVLGALNNHKIVELVKYNRALKIAERVELKSEEIKQINLVVKENGIVQWGMDDDGKTLPDFKDIVAEIELSDEMSEFLKEVIETKVKSGIVLSSTTDKALMDVYTQIQDPARAS